MKLLAAVFLILHGVTAHKILVYNIRYSHSHSNFLGNLADVLVEAGHDVTSFIPEVSSTTKDGTVKSKIVRIPADDIAKKELSRMLDGVDFFELEDWGLVGMGGGLAKVFAAQCEAILDRHDVLDKLKQEKFDVYIVENADMCGLAISELIKPKSIIMTTTGALYGPQYEEVGVPQPLSFNPTLSMASLDVHSFWSRLRNIYGEVVLRYGFNQPRYRVHDIFRRRFGNDFPSFQEITSNIAYAFTNSEPLIDYATPTLNRVIPIGGLGAKEPKELNDYWQEILNRRPSTVLISFGSMVKSINLKLEVKRSFLKVMLNMSEVTFIWKYENIKDDFALNEASHVPNLVLTEWMPQNDLLNHANLKVFMTHGGMASVQEIALRGVPGLFVPIFADQPRNAGAMAHNGLGKLMNKFDLISHERIEANIRELLDNDRYSNNCRRMARMLAKKPFSAKEQLIKYVEFAAEFGSSSALRPQSHDMNWIEYHNVDIVASFIPIVLIISYAFFTVMCCICSRQRTKLKSH